jgi:hypothetical protein
LLRWIKRRNGLRVEPAMTRSSYCAGAVSLETGLPVAAAGALGAPELLVSGALLLMPPTELDELDELDELVDTAGAAVLLGPVLLPDVVLPADVMLLPAVLAGVLGAGRVEDTELPLLLAEPPMAVELLPEYAVPLPCPCDDAPIDEVGGIVIVRVDGVAVLSGGRR